jgi:hypothetical protein
MITFNSAYGNPLEMKSYFQQELLKNGILWSGFHNMSYSHSDEDIEYTLEVYTDVLQKLKNAVEEKTLSRLVLGEAIKPVFRKVTNFNTKPKI